MHINTLKAKLAEIVPLKDKEDKAVACRELLISAVDFIYEKSGGEKPKQATLLELIEGPVVGNYVNNYDLIKGMDIIRIVGMHSKNGTGVRRKYIKVVYDNIEALINYIEAKENGTVDTFKSLPYMNEANTRKIYVDVYLNEAGWAIQSVENVAAPCKAGIEIEVQGMPNAKNKGFCDYVLYGKDGKPLAIVEVKKTSSSPEIGRHQVCLYAECMEKVYGYKPVLYYTNGYETKIIDGLYPDRTVFAFHTIDELELMIQRRDRNDIVDFTINDNITNRPYQKMAITSVCEWLNKKRRRGLLVMATGTGKTRVAISLVDVLTKNKWVKNVLFLADRTTLVHQAKDAFEHNMTNMSICELSASGDKDYNARLMFCTYQSMIKYIDAEDKRFTSGRFDLIIIDEAHRSIFNRYGTIFKYFDSLLIGLTATPKNEVDANTYKIFGCEAGIPNFDYSIEEAVKDHYLVGYHVINRTSKLISEGIHIPSLTPEEKNQLIKYFKGDLPAGEVTIPGSELFKILYNEETCRRVVEELMRWGLRVDDGETIGKSIIFAYNHEHAKMIVKCFNDLYPELGKDDVCQLVDYSISYADDLVKKFKTEAKFRIAVSVDMMDTGVDVPEVLNLVFFKPVRSKIKFIQMIGRGTRLCENVYGYGQHKSGFNIFDYCGNFEYFHFHPDEKMGSEQLTLSQRIFQLKLDMLFELQRLEYQERPWYQSYYSALKTELHGNVVKIRTQRSRIQVREEMKYVDIFYDKDKWISLSEYDVKDVKIHLSPLIDSGINGDHYAVAFDARIYNVGIALLKHGSIASASTSVKNIRLAAQYILENKATVPEVQAKIDNLKKAKDEVFWDNVTVPELEALRISLRSIMHLLKDKGPGAQNVDISDIIKDSEFIVEDTMIDIRTYREKVKDYLLKNIDSEAIRKIHYLEPITDQDLEELERILWTELGSREDYNDTTDIANLVAFVRTLIGLNQEAVNEKFGEYISGNVFNAQQQEFVKTIIDYVRENGDIEVADMVNSEPFNNYDLFELFGNDLQKVVGIVTTIHGSVVARG